MKTLGLRLSIAAGAWLASASATAAPPEGQPAARMSIVAGKDVSGTVYRKLALPSLKYCWDACIKERQCSGARWGVIQGDVAGLCVLLRGELTLKAPTAPSTDDGKPIHVTAAKKVAAGTGDGA